MDKGFPSNEDFTRNINDILTPDWNSLSLPDPNTLPIPFPNLNANTTESLFANSNKNNNSLEMDLEWANSLNLNNTNLDLLKQIYNFDTPETETKMIDIETCVDLEKQIANNLENINVELECNVNIDCNMDNSSAIIEDTEKSSNVCLQSFIKEFEDEYTAEKLVDEKQKNIENACTDWNEMEGEQLLKELKLRGEMLNEFMHELVIELEKTELEAEYLKEMIAEQKDDRFSSITLESEKQEMLIEEIDIKCDAENEDIDYEQFFDNFSMDMDENHSLDGRNINADENESRNVSLSPNSQRVFFNDKNRSKRKKNILTKMKTMEKRNEAKAVDDDWNVILIDVVRDILRD